MHISIVNEYQLLGHARAVPEQHTYRGTAALFVYAISSFSFLYIYSSDSPGASIICIYNREGRKFSLVISLQEIRNLSVKHTLGTKSDLFMVLLNLTKQLISIFGLSCIVWLENLLV